MEKLFTSHYLFLVFSFSLLPLDRKTKDHPFPDGLGFPHQQLLLLKDLFGHTAVSLQYFNQIGALHIVITEAIAVEDIPS